MVRYNHFFNKIVVFFNPGKATYWHTITRNTLDSKPNVLGRYYLNFESKLNYPDKIDVNGIPLYTIAGLSYFHHPIVVCQYALGIYEHLHQSHFKNEKLKTEFLKQADWLLNNYIEINFGRGWNVGYDIPEYELHQPWFLGLAQGEAASVLTRAYQLTDNIKYLELAEDAIKPFEKNVSEGGLLNHFKSFPIYEEYPSNRRTVGALCGFMFILFGFYDLMLTNQNLLATDLFNKGIQSLKNLLPFYDLGYWSRYYLFDYPKEYVASYTYHSLQYEQLKSLYYITGEKVFLEYSQKWEKYSNSYYCKLTALAKKLTYAKKLSW